MQNIHPRLPYTSNDIIIRRSKRLAAADKQSAASETGARCIAMEEMFVTLGQQGAWWPLLETCEVEKFGKAWGIGHCVRVAACGKAGENETRVCKWREIPVWRRCWRRIGDIGSWHSVASILPLYLSESLQSIARPLADPALHRWNGRQKIVRIRDG